MAVTKSRVTAYLNPKLYTHNSILSENQTTIEEKRVLFYQSFALKLDWGESDRLDQSIVDEQIWFAELN